MKMALELAGKANDETYPNPMVGAVIVSSGEIVGKGYHKKAGLDHAEIVAIKQAKEKCKNATLYVTLEPCDHQGKTPPCTEAIIKNGIKKVYIGTLDPNPLNSGRGMQKLKSAGIAVEMGLCEEEARNLNRKYNKFISKNVPYLTAKLAQSVDGKIAARDGSSKWITSDTSRKYVKELRGKFDAIMVGANTAIKDDPLLLPQPKTDKVFYRIVIDSSLRLSTNSQLVRTASKKNPLIIATTSSASKAKIGMLEKRVAGIEVAQVKSERDRVSLKTFLRKLAKMGIVNILVEGGGELVGGLLDEGLVDEVIIFVAPKILGGPYSSIKGKGVSNITKAIDLKDMTMENCGGDIIIRGLI